MRLVLIGYACNNTCIIRVLTNSKFGVFYSNFLILTPTFSKVPIEKYGKTPIFSGKQHFYSYFQNPSENSNYNVYFQPPLVQACFHGDPDEVRALLYKKEDVNYQVCAIGPINPLLHRQSSH